MTSTSPATLRRVADMLADHQLAPGDDAIIDALCLAIIAIARHGRQDQAERVRNIGRIMDQS